jgi:hypothetical protein
LVMGVMGRFLFPEVAGCEIDGVAFEEEGET